MLASFLFCRQYVLDADLPGPLSKFADTRERPVNFLLSPIELRDKPCYGATMSRNDEGLATLDVVKQLRQAGFGIGSLNFTHRPVKLTSQIIAHVPIDQAPTGLAPLDNLAEV